MLSNYLTVIKNKDFRFLWLAQITSQIALNMLSFVLAIIVYQATHSNTAVSLILLSFAIPSIIFGIVAGGIVDFYDKRVVLLICNVSRFILLLGFFLFSQNILFLFVLTVLISIITQFFIPAEAPSIASLVTEKDLLSANSLFTISFYLSMMMGFIAAGPVIRFFGDKNAYLVMSFLLFLATVFVYFLPSIKPQKSKSKVIINLKLFTDTIEDGLRFINENIRIKQSLILLTFSQALISTLAVLTPGFADKILGIDLKDASFLIMGPAAVGLILGAFLVGGFGYKYLKGKIILAGIIAVSATLLLLSFISKAHSPSIGFYIYPLHTTFVISNLVSAIILLFFLGIFNSFISVCANAILQGDADTQMRGRIYGVLTSLTGGVSLLPVVFSSILADIVGVSRALLVLGLAVLIAGIYHYLQRKTVTSIIK